MVNFRKLSDRAKKARGVIEQQGGTDALKEKAGRIGDIAKSKGSVGDKAKAAAQVAKEKPQPGAETRGEQGEGPVGGGGAPPEPQPTPSATGPDTKAATGARTDKVTPEQDSSANS
jgi:hypothetical protein